MVQLKIGYGTFNDSNAKTKIDKKKKKKKKKKRITTGLNV